MSSFKRLDGRSYNQLRNIKIIVNAFGYAPGNLLFQMGDTKVLCSVTMQTGVPPFLKGKKTGWLTAEYAMIPTATKKRTDRPSNAIKQQGRSVEISRLIARVLRAVVDLSTFPERTIMIDCDVLQADGGTRSAAITGSCIALQIAQTYWLKNGFIDRLFLKEPIAAISVGMMKQEPLLDLNAAEDNIIDNDFNFVIAKSGAIVEIQGSAENALLVWNDFELMKNLAIKGVNHLFDYIDDKDLCIEKKERKIPMFSLQSRLNNSL